MPKGRTPRRYRVDLFPVGLSDRGTVWRVTIITPDGDRMEPYETPGRKADVQTRAQRCAARLTELRKSAGRVPPECNYKRRPTAEERP